MDAGGDPGDTPGTSRPLGLRAGLPLCFRGAPASPRDGTDEVYERREGDEAQAVEGDEPEDAPEAQ